MKHPLYLITRYLKATGDETCEKLYKIMDDHAATFAAAKGSMHNHQAWPGGYWQHVADTMQLAQRIMFATMPKGWPVPFSWSSVVLVLFLHDIEKPFMQERMANNPEMPLWPKEQRAGFRDGIIYRYQIAITEEERIALKFIRGEESAHSHKERKMNELGALCHAADVLSARLWHSRNKPEENKI